MHSSSRSDWANAAKISIIPISVSAGLLAAIFMAATVFASSDRSKVAVTIEGDIAPRCVVASLNAGRSGAVELTNITKAGRFINTYSIDCNTPFHYNISSENGGFLHDSPPQEGKSAPVRLPYSVAVYIPTDDVTINDRCTSDSIKAGQATCRLHDSGHGVAIASQGVLSLEWTSAEGLPPAGRFIDRLTFTIEAKP